MSTAKKQDIPELEELSEEMSDELDFDVSNDWRKDADATQTNIFKEDDMDVADDDMDTSIFQLDTKGEIAKEQAREHTKAMAAARKHARNKGKGDSDTLKALQEAAHGGEIDDDDELEILTEEDKALVNDPIFTNKGDQYPQIHGNYFLLDHLVDGGMAKVCRARYLGEGDEADKMVAIKMVQEKFSSDESFVQMFVDEIKVSFGLNHPNINTTFDYGKIGKNLFVSMEYIHGKDLMVVIDELKKNKETLPVPMAIFIASKMSEALHYAHNFTNKLTGQKYNIVHRDISPHNAMVSYEGFVKVIDFGIAKADTNETEEAEGTIKGKINYFAPEYLEGKKIDHRYDQFAVALTLWEMLTGDKTFKAADQLLTLKKILECNPERPSRYNKDIPKDLEQVIMKALSKDPANRYKDMQAFNKELMKVLYKNYPDFHESDIGEMMKNLFQDSYESDLEKFKGFGQYSISDIVAKIKAYKEFQQRQKEKAKASGGKAKEVEFDFGFSEESVSVRSGKKGLDKLFTGKKKEKPGLSTSKSHRKRQKALAALLEEDEDFVKADSSLERNKGKIFFLALLALGFFQRELIMSTFLGGEAAMPTVKTGQPQKIHINPDLKKAKDKHREAMKFVEQLKKRQAEEAAKQNQQTSGSQAQGKAQAPAPNKKAQQPSAEKGQANVPPSSQGRAEPVNQADVKALLKKVQAQTAPQESKPLPENSQAQQPAQQPTQQQVQPQGSPVNRVPANSQRPARFENRPTAVTSFEEAKQLLDKTMNKEKARKLEGALDAAKSELTQPKSLKEQIKQAADIDNLSIEQLRARMEAQLAKRKLKVQKPRENAAAPTKVPKEKGTAPPTQASSGFGNEGGPNAGGEASGEYEGESYEGESFEGESFAQEEESQPEMPQGSLNDAAKEALANLRKKEETVSPAPEAPTAATNIQEQPAQQNDTQLKDTKHLSEAEIQILKLKAKMARIEEEQKKLEEGKSLKKLDITLSDDEKVNGGEQQESVVDDQNGKSKAEIQAEIQRELASRLEDITEGKEEGSQQQDKGVIDNMVDFIKTRRAFGWMFD